jgi:hypothetical protein
MTHQTWQQSQQHSPCLPTTHHSPLPAAPAQQQQQGVVLETWSCPCAPSHPHQQQQQQQQVVSLVVPASPAVCHP